MHHALRRSRVVNIVRHHPGHAERARQRDERGDERALLLEAMVPAFDGEASAEDVVQPARGVTGAGIVAGDEPRGHEPAHAAGERVQSVGVFSDRAQRKRGAPALAVHPRTRDQRGEIPVALPRFGEEYEVVRGAVLAAHRELRADDAFEPGIVAGLREGDRTAQLIVIGEGEGAVAECERAIHELVGVRRAIEQ